MSTTSSNLNSRLLQEAFAYCSKIESGEITDKGLIVNTNSLIDNPIPITNHTKILRNKSKIKKKKLKKKLKKNPLSKSLIKEKEKNFTNTITKSSKINSKTSSSALNMASLVRNFETG